MIIEILMLLGGGLYATSAGINLYSRSQKPKLPELPTIDPATVMPEGDTATLVVELLRSDNGWRVLRDRSAERDTIEHETGIKITKQVSHGYHYSEYVFVYVMDQKGAYQHVDTNASDDKILLRELKAFHNRQRDAKQRALTRALAQRIVARERGEVQPLLGGPGSDGSTPATNSGSGNSSQADATGLLTYDPASQQVVATVRGDSVKLRLDATLRRRYQLSDAKSDKELGEIQDRIIAAAAAGSAFDYMDEDEYDI